MLGINNYTDSGKNPAICTRKIMMEYVSLEERILSECQEQAKEYLLRKGTYGLLGLFSALSDNSAKNFMDFISSWKKPSEFDLLLCVIPLVLKNGKSLETKKAIDSIKNIALEISNKDLFDCLILFSML